MPVDMPDLVRAYLNSFIGMHTILCTRGPQASKLISNSVIKELATPSFHLFAMDTDARGEVSQITDYIGKKSRFAMAADDVPSTKSVAGMLLSLTLSLIRDADVTDVTDVTDVASWCHCMYMIN